MKIEMTELKIEEVYKVALKLGVNNAKEFEKDIFKKALREIAMTAIDEARREVEQTLHELSLRYTNQPQTK